MNSILVKDLVKDFEITVRSGGIAGSLKSFVHPTKKKVRALKGVTFDIHEGELVGLIGPNGAGKTTTLKILSGLLHPTDGLVHVGGFIPWERKYAYLESIALVMGQKNQLWWDLPAVDTFELNKAIYSISDSRYRTTMSELVEVLEVSDLLQTPVRKLSLGQRMRLELVASLLHRPKTLFLDEPTIGLDVVAQQKVRDFVRDYNRKHNVTIILTSHNMNDVADLAKRVIVITHGEIIFDGNLTELVNKFAKDKIIKVLFSSDVNYKRLGEIGTVVSVEMPRVVISIPRSVAAVAAAEILQNFPVSDLTIEEESIEEVIRKVFSA